MSNTPFEQHKDSLLLQAALCEYNALYRLAEFRLSALDRRIPIVGGLLTAFLSSVPLLPHASQLIALFAIPISLIWLVRTTINHARSFEDALRRIEYLEHRVNQLLGSDVMGFQSTHPSKGNMVGGRTGSESIGAVMIASALMLVICGIMACMLHVGSHKIIISLSLIQAGVAFTIARSFMGWKAYQYQHNE